LPKTSYSNSPILVRPIEGREVIAAIFAQSSSTRGSGAYTAESKLDERTTFLRWLGAMDGHKFESLEVIVDNEQGLIVERAIALRPYPALKLFRDAMHSDPWKAQTWAGKRVEPSGTPAKFPKKSGPARLDRSTSLHAQESECRLSHRVSDPLTATAGPGQE
jgi:hypothetical protein